MSNNPLLNKTKLPGRIFALPSKGIFYKDGILSEKAKQTGEIEVKPMSALSEIKLKSSDLLYSGRVLQEICNECIPDILNADELVTKDVDAIFIYLRIATYGNMLDINSSHDCKNAKYHSYIVPLEETISSLNNDILNGSVDVLFSTKLNTGENVKLKPLSFGNGMRIAHLQNDISVKLGKDQNEEYTKLLQEITMLDSACIIDNVDGESKPEHIIEWLKTLTKPQINQIQKQYIEAINWGISTKYSLKCKDCGKHYDHELQLDPVSFFSG